MDKLIQKRGTDKLSFIYYSDIGVIKSGSYNSLDDRILTNRTQFRIASLTKTIVALSILRMYDANKIDIKIPINSFPLLAHMPKKITIWHLMTHTSGLPRMPIKYEFKTKPRHYSNMRQVVLSFINEPYTYDTFGKTSYSNISYMILGYILEEITGTSWLTACKKWVLIPLKMRDTGVGVQDYLYEIPEKNGRNGKTRAIKNAGKLDELYWASSSGSLHSTIADLIQFAKGFQNMLKPATLRLYRFCWYETPAAYYEFAGRIFGGESYIRVNNNTQCYIFLSNVTRISPVDAFL